LYARCSDRCCACTIDCCACGSPIWRANIPYV
jgi:hypothetical protein